MFDAGEDGVKRVSAHLDQLTATWRDTLIPATVDIEELVLKQGGSDELAEQAAVMFLDRLLKVMWDRNIS